MGLKFTCNSTFNNFSSSLSPLPSPSCDNMQFLGASHSEKPTLPSVTPGTRGGRAVDFDEDLALGVAGEHARPIDRILDARVVRKIDLFLMPTMFIGTNVTEMQLSN
jgi:hypothetical protein